MSDSTAKKYFKYIKSSMTLENIVFVLVLLAIIAYLFFQIIILQTSSPQVAVTTTSMVPTYQGYDLTEDPNLRSTPYLFDIFRGDLLIVQNIEPKVGDVIVFDISKQPTLCDIPSFSSAPIVHRIVAMKWVDGIKYFATKGDHNPYSDAGICSGNHFGWIPRSSILGVVVFSIHYLGWFSLLLQNPFVRGILIVLVLVVIALTIFDSTNKNEEKNKENSNLKTGIPKKKVYLKFKSKSLRINRSRLFVCLIFFLILTTYFGVGLLNYSTGKNSVSWVRTGSNEKSGIINLISSDSGTMTENYSLGTNNLYFYNYQWLINSSGSLNFVSKVSVTAIINTLNITCPSFVWTIVYDYYGSKSINAVFIFELPHLADNTHLNTTIQFTVYSSGLLATSPITTNVDVTVIV